jgi:hypothetical protein
MAGCRGNGIADREKNIARRASGLTNSPSIGMSLIDFIFVALLSKCRQATRFRIYFKNLIALDDSNNLPKNENGCAAVPPNDNAMLLEHSLFLRTSELSNTL